MAAPLTSRPTLGARVLKAIGLFSSVQFAGILCAVVRTKLVAVIIGATGVGIISLYNSTLEMLRSVMMLNLNQTAVREISSARDSLRAAVAHEVGRTALRLGIIAALITAAISPLLSILAFGKSSYTWAFCLLSLTLLAGAVTDGRTAVLQSFGQLKSLARASLAGVVCGTVIAVPAYLIWRIDAIVPVILIYSASTLLFTLLPKIPRPDAPLPVDESRIIRRRILTLGVWLTVGVFMGFAALYILRIWLNSVAGVEVVGRFQAGFTIVNTYMGVLFTAIAVEFYPRLVNSIHSARATALMVGHEITLALWVLIAVVPVFLALQQVVVRVLYSSEFDIITCFTTLAVSGSMLRAVSWCFSYVILAKADGRIYLFTEGASAVSLIVFGMFGWSYGGYYGLGLAYLLQYVVFTIVTALVYRYRYGLSLPKRVNLLIFIAIGLGLTSTIVTLIFGWIGATILAIPSTTLALISIKKLISKSVR